MFIHMQGMCISAFIHISAIYLSKESEVRMQRDTNSIKEIKRKFKATQSI